MRLPDDKTKYSNQWKYVELARYVFSAGRVLREMSAPQQARIVEFDQVEEYRARHNNTGIYTSVFHYNSFNLDEATRLGPLYFDLDSDNADEARRDAEVLYTHLLKYGDAENIRIYFTGKKGFHIEVEPLAAGITPSNQLPATFRFIANDLRERLNLTTIDFQVYDLRRIWRLPGSKHQDTNLFKRLVRYEDIELGIDHIRELALQPDNECVPEQEFNPQLNEWYRDYTYQIEKSKQEQVSTADLIERFRKMGSSGLKDFSDTERVFDPIRLFDNCPAITRLWDKAEKEHHLEHEERLFLLSILSYTDEAIWYLHQILQNCSDYDRDKTNAHIDDWVKRRKLEIGGRPFSCERANEAGIGCGNCNLDMKKKWIKAGGKWVETDSESKPSPVRFAYSYKKGEPAHSKPVSNDNSLSYEIDW